MIRQIQSSAHDAHDARRLIESQVVSCVPHAAEDLEKLENSALESYQSDTYHHPEMGTGTKITRAGIKGIATAGLGYAGATYNSIADQLPRMLESLQLTL